MHFLIASIILLSTFLTVAYFRFKPWQSILLFAAITFILYKASLINFATTLGLLIIVGAIGTIITLPTIRKKLITSKAFNWFKTVLPPISETEQEAIKAGNVWWDAELFSGKPNWSMLLDTPEKRLSDEEQAFLDNQTETLCQMLDDWKIRQELKDLPEEVWNYIKKEKFLSMIIPKKFGGLEFSAHAQSAVLVKIASRNITAAVTIMVPNSLGPGELLLKYGTKKQQEHYLPKLADGIEIPCFALTGPTAGSDASSIPDRGIICEKTFNGKKTLGISVSWNKRYITLAPIATVLGLAFKTYDPDALLGDKKDLGITCALIPTETEGVMIGNRHFPIGAVFMNGPTSGSEIFIPLDWVIGGKDRIGQGWRMLMNCLAVGRAISLPALGTAGAKVSTFATGAYARVRSQFKIPIGYFEGVSEQLTVIAGNTYRMNAARELTLSALDIGQKPGVISAILKYCLSEGNRTVINAAMDVHGGKGIIEGPKNYLANGYESLPISITVEGANILTRSLIIFGQGAIRCHPYLLNEMLSVSNENQQEGLNDFDKNLTQHVGFTISNAVRSLVMGLTGAKLIKSPVDSPTNKYYQQLTRMSSAFAFVADVTLLILGGKFKIKETLSGRFADILSHLYLASAALKKFEDDNQPQEDLALVSWAVEDSLNLCQERLMDIFHNFPIPAAGPLLKWLTFPIGRSFKKSNDKINKKVAQLILNNTQARQQLIDGIYLNTTSKDDATAQLESAFQQVIATDSIATAIKHATGETVTLDNYQELIKNSLASGIIAEEQAKELTAAQLAVLEVIAVDDFEWKQTNTAKKTRRIRKAS